MSQAEEVLKQGMPQQAQLNYDMSQYNTNYNNMMNSYQKTTDSALNKYQQTGTQNIDALKQQTQQQISFLNQQLEANKQKYQLQGEQQTATINKQYNEANTQIDNQAFENYKMSNQMGATRGVSNSAQQMAMDNSVGQQTAGLFNQNLTSKNDSINTLKNTIQSQMLDLDMQHASSVNDLQVNQMSKQMEIINSMSEKEFDYVSQQADKILQLQMSNNELQFNTQKEVEQYKAQLAVKLYEMQFSNAQTIDDRTFQSAESQKDRDFQAGQNEQDRALQKYLASLSGGSGGSGGSSSSSSSNETFTEDEIMFQEQLAYNMEVLGMSYIEAQDKAKKEVENYINTGNSKVVANSGINIMDAIANRAKNNYGLGSGTTKKTNTALKGNSLTSPITSGALDKKLQQIVGGFTS